MHSIVSWDYVNTKWVWCKLFICQLWLNVPYCRRSGWALDRYCFRCFHLANNSYCTCPEFELVTLRMWRVNLTRTTKDKSNEYCNPKTHFEILLSFSIKHIKVTPSLSVSLLRNLYSAFSELETLEAVHRKYCSNTHTFL